MKSLKKFLRFCLKNHRVFFLLFIIFISYFLVFLSVTPRQSDCNKRETRHKVGKKMAATRYARNAVEDSQRKRRETRRDGVAGAVDTAANHRVTDRR